LDAVYADQTPADKFAAVRAETDRAVTVMVGDGVNDAPALAAATVGVAMGARGATASSEAADVVLTTDRLDRLADAMDIARWSRRIAVQSAVVGMSLSLLAMAIAAFGWLPPAAGALLQEGIDVAVILNALRAVRGNPATEVRLAAGTEQMLRRFAAEHDELRDTIGLLRDSADRLAAGPDAAALESLTAAHALLTERILPHEQAEETQLYPALARPLGSGEATATMSRTHAEIQRLADRIGTHLALAQAAGAIGPDQVDDLLACLYGLYTLLRLHFVQEEENYFVLPRRHRERRNTVPAKATRNHGRSDYILTNWCAANLVINPRIPSTLSVSRFIRLLGLFPCFFSGHKCVIHYRVGQQPVSVELQSRQNHVLAVVPQHRFHIGRVVMHVQVEQESAAAHRAKRRAGFRVAAGLDGASAHCVLDVALGVVDHLAHQCAT
jgi:hypothetical protein